MTFKIFIKHLFYLYRFSFLKLHLSTIFIVIFIHLTPFILIFFKINIDFEKIIVNLNNNLSNTLTGLSILMAFFIFIAQGINYSKINITFNDEIDFKSRDAINHIKTNKVIKNTIFSFILTPLILLIPLLGLLITRPSASQANITLDFIIYILICLIIIYLLVGILFSIVFWSYTVTRD